MKKMQGTVRKLAILLILGIMNSVMWAQSQTRESGADNEIERNSKSSASSTAGLSTQELPAKVKDLYEQARKYAARGYLELAIATYESFLMQAGTHAEGEEQLHAVRQQLEQKQLTDKLDRKYTSGMAALRARDWARAIVEFETVLLHDANYREASRRLNDALNKFANDNAETAAIRLYALGVAAQSMNELDEAHAAFGQLLRLQPDYLDVRARAQAIDRARTNLAASNGEDARLDSLYRTAEQAASRKDWREAVIALEALRLVQPNYRDADARLADARMALHLSQSSTRATSEGAQVADNSSVLIAGAATLLVLPTLGWLFFSSSVRARRSLLRHDYRSAARVYENLLARHPTRVKYFSKLANIYLLEGRKDEEAMRVYRNVLQLNLATNNREEINTVVAQQYLQEGRTDSDAIEVLEKQLEAEMHRQDRALLKA